MDNKTFEYMDKRTKIYYELKCKVEKLDRTLTRIEGKQSVGICTEGYSEKIWLEDKDADTIANVLKACKAELQKQMDEV